MASDTNSAGRSELAEPVPGPPPKSTAGGARLQASLGSGTLATAERKVGSVERWEGLDNDHWDGTVDAELPVLIISVGDRAAVLLEHRLGESESKAVQI